MQFYFYKSDFLMLQRSSLSRWLQKKGDTMKLSKYLVMAALLIAVTAGIAAAALPAIISGFVTNAANGKPVAGAKVWIKGAGAVIAAKNGAYLMTVPAGYVTLCSVSTGYTSTCKPRFNVLSGQSKKQNITLAPK